MGLAVERGQLPPGSYCTSSCLLKIFFADETHLPGGRGIAGQRVQKGELALVDSRSPRHGDKASYYPVVCFETGEVKWMELEGNSNGESSVFFLEH